MLSSRLDVCWCVVHNTGRAFKRLNYLSSAFWKCKIFHPRAAMKQAFCEMAHDGHREC